MNAQIAQLNLVPGGVPTVVTASQYDVGRTFTFTIWDGLTQYTIPAGATVRVSGRKEDNHAFSYDESDGAITISQDRKSVTVITLQQMTCVYGDVMCEITIENNEAVIGSGNFTLRVEVAPVNDEAIISDTELPAIIEGAKEDARRAEAAANAADASAIQAASSATAAAGSATAAENSATAAAGSATTAQEAANIAVQAELHPPYIGQNGNWWVWSTTTSEYVDSGIDASITVQIADITMIAATATPYVTNSGTNTDPIFHLYIPYGVGIANITKTGTSGLVDTYTITYTDGNTTTYTVTNGKTAYQSAQDGGYTGTEAEFNTTLGNIPEYATAAANSATAAANSASAASTSETNAGNSATAAAASATAAAGSASDAAGSATAAAGSATDAGNSATAASGSATAAAGSATNAAASETAAAASETAAAGSETAAGNSATAAAGSAQNALASAMNARSWAEGGTGTRIGEDTNNSYYYSQISYAQAQEATHQAEVAASYAAFVTPHYIIQNNRLYVNNQAAPQWTVANNRLYVKLVA